MGNSLGAKRTPTNILKMRGAYKKHPERLKEREFEPIVTAPLGECPADLGPLVKATWDEIAKYAPAGVLTSADRLSVELAAVLLAAHRLGECGDKGRAQLIQLYGKFGMNPADRSKVQVPKQQPSNPFDQLNEKSAR
jgi:hypothetical protein